MEAKFYRPSGIVSNVATNTLYVAGNYNQTIRKIVNNGTKLTGNSSGEAGSHDVVLEVVDSEGNKTQQSFTIVVEGALGFESIGSTNRIKAWLNPQSKSIESSAKIVQVYNTTGQVVVNTNLISGVYYVRVVDSKNKVHVVQVLVY